MLKLRLLSTFTVIGLILIALGIVGMVPSWHFVYDPGQTADRHDPWYYLAIGVLMVVNGLVMPAPLPDETKEQDRKKAEAGTSAPISNVISTESPRD